jgi:hypothetical protein
VSRPPADHFDAKLRAAAARASTPKWGEKNNSALEINPWVAGLAVATSNSGTADIASL